MFKIAFKTLLFIILLSLEGFSQVITLDSVRNSIVARNPELKMYQSQAKAFDAMAEGATAWDAPQIGAGFFMTPYKTAYWKNQTIDSDGMSSTAPGMGNFMIQVNQMIPNPGRLQANKRVQMAMSSVENENKNAAANDLLYQAKVSYHEIQIIDRKLKVLDESMNTVKIMVQLGENKIAYNQENLASVYKAKSQAALLEKDKWMMESERKQKIYALNSLMYRSKEQLFSVDTLYVLKNYDQVYVDSSTLVNNRSDLLAIDRNIQVTMLKQKAELTRSRPDFGIEYGHMIAFGSNPNLFTLMGMMSIPIAPWSSKMYKSNIKANRFEIEAMTSKKEAIVSESIGMLKGTKNEIASAKYQIKLYSEMILPSLQKTYDVSMLAYSNNTGELFMALDARMNLQMAKMQYWDTVLTLLKFQDDYEKQMQIY